MRFIDDILLIWEHGRAELDKFILHLNTVHRTIKFTSEISLNEVSFLDTMVHLDPTQGLSTDLFVKPTDSNNYFLYTSAHPRHCKRGIPFGQFLRIRRICSDDKSFLKHCIEKGKHFTRRKYPSDLIIRAFREALKVQRSKLLENNANQKETQANILVTTFHPESNVLKGVVAKNWDILGRSCSTREIHSKNVLTAYRRPKNLKDLLVRAKLPKAKPNTEPTPTLTPCNPCNTRTCRYCPKLNKSGRITCTASDRSYKTRYNCTCKSSNLIYCLSCKRCGIQYVGQTKNRLMDRFQDHFYKIGHNKPNSEIAKHFNLPDHKGLEDVELCVLDFIHADPVGRKSKYLRDLIEFNWIQRLHTNAPTGLNVMDPI